VVCGSQERFTVIDGSQPTDSRRLLCVIDNSLCCCPTNSRCKVHCQVLNQQLCRLWQSQQGVRIDRGQPLLQLVILVKWDEWCVGVRDFAVGDGPA